MSSKTTRRMTVQSKPERSCAGFGEIELNGPGYSQRFLQILRGHEPADGRVRQGRTVAVPVLVDVMTFDSCSQLAEFVDVDWLDRITDIDIVGRHLSDSTDRGPVDLELNDCERIRLADARRRRCTGRSGHDFAGVVTQVDRLGLFLATLRTAVCIESHPIVPPCSVERD